MFDEDAQAEQILGLVRAFLGDVDGARDAELITGTILSWFAARASGGHLKLVRAMAALTGELRARRVALLRAIAAAPAFSKLTTDSRPFVSLIVDRLAAEPGLEGSLAT